MAKKEENKKGFLVIKTESLSEALKLGGVAVCDSCNKSTFTGYYIAVLNKWMCERCYEEWIYFAKRYEEDIPVEQHYYDMYAKILGVVDLQNNVSH